MGNSLEVTRRQEKYLRNIRALDYISIDFEYKSGYYRERREEEKYPYKKGERDRHIRQMALLKGMTNEEFIEAASTFKSKEKVP